MLSDAKVESSGSTPSSSFVMFVQLGLRSRSALLRLCRTKHSIDSWGKLPRLLGRVVEDS